MSRKTSFGARALTVALTFAAMIGLGSPVSAGEPPAFRLLKLNGSSVKWGTPELGTGATVTYAFLEAPMHFPEARNCRAMVGMDALLSRSGVERSAFEAETAEAFEAWSAVAGIEFRRVRDTAEADILIGAQLQPLGRAFANVAHDRPAASEVRPISKSLICLNPDELWKIGFDGNLDVYDLRYSLTHEIGHAIGLDHPGDEDQVMSYRYEEQVAGLQPGDVLGARMLYGGRQNVTTALQEVASVTGSRGVLSPTGSHSGVDQQTRALPARAGSRRSE